MDLHWVRSACDLRRLAAGLDGSPTTNHLVFGCVPLRQLVLFKHARHRLS